jgi:hypothetical protein
MGSFFRDNTLTVIAFFILCFMGVLYAFLDENKVQLRGEQWRNKFIDHCKLHAHRATECASQAEAEHPNCFIEAMPPESYKSYRDCMKRKTAEIFETEDSRERRKREEREGEKFSPSFL